MTPSRIQAEAVYAAAQKVWLAACHLDSATFEKADEALKIARKAVVAAELADPTPKEAKRHAKARNARGIELSSKWG